MMARNFSALMGMSAQARSLSFEERVRLIRIETFFGHAAGNMLGIGVATLVFAFVLHDAGQAPAIWGLGRCWSSAWPFHWRFSSSGLRERG